MQGSSLGAYVVIFSLARRGNFAGVTQLFRELPILDFELLERLELTDVEIARGIWRRILSDRFRHFAGELETPAGRTVTEKIQTMRERRFHGRAIFAAPDQKKRRPKPAAFSLSESSVTGVLRPMQPPSGTIRHRL